jgi:hypothetical protein
MNSAIFSLTPMLSRQAEGKFYFQLSNFPVPVAPPFDAVRRARKGIAKSVKILRILVRLALTVVAGADTNRKAFVRNV